MQDIIVIVGPTGVGKTKLSIELAKKIDAEVINGDSVSIYKDLNIGSAKPTISERENIRHHLIDIREVDDEYSVYDYQNDVRKLIEEITKRNKRIIIVGGTGLYIKAALYDYKFTTGTTNKSYDDLSNEEVYNKLLKYDENISVHVNNRQRLIRLLNKYENAEIISYDKDRALYPIKVIGLTTSREVLYERIDTRVEEMFKMGLLHEVESLKDYYKTSRVLNTGIGYKEFYDYLFNNLTIDEVKSKIKLDSRHYAKRQYTFFKHQFCTKWFETDFSCFQKTINEVYKYIEKKDLD